MQNLNLVPTSPVTSLAASVVWGQISILDNFPNPENPTPTSFVKPKDQLHAADKIKKLHPLYESMELYGIPAQRVTEPQWNDSSLAD